MDIARIKEIMESDEGLTSRLVFRDGFTPAEAELSPVDWNNDMDYLIKRGIAVWDIEYISLDNRAFIYRDSRDGNAWLIDPAWLVEEPDTAKNFNLANL